MPAKRRASGQTCSPSRKKARTSYQRASPTVMVCGSLVTDVESVKSALSRFGHVNLVESTGYSSARAHFSNSESVDFALRTQYLRLPSGGEGVIFPDTGPVRSRRGENGYFLQALKPPLDKLVDDDTVLKQVQKHTNVQDQMHELCQMILLTDEEVASRRAYCLALQAVLSCYFPDCTLSLFGSSENGYGCKGCDLDLYLDFGGEEVSSGAPVGGDMRKAARRFQGAHLPSVQNIATDPEEREKLARLHPCAKMMFLVRLLRYHLRPMLSSCCFIPARCPIVRFTDRRGSIQCDINATSGTSVVNTNLLKTFNQCDPRVRPLLLATRTWFRVHGLLDSLNCFSSYAVSLLVCCYLQRVDPPILPTLEQLAELHSKAGGKPEFADGYRCDFVQSKTLLPSSSNTADLGTLLEGLFMFLQELNYEGDAIVVRSATIVPRPTFYATLDSTKHNLFENSPVAMQDPFILHNNVTRLVKLQAVEVLVQRAEEALGACRDGKDLVWLLSSQPLSQICKAGLITNKGLEYELFLATNNAGRFQYDCGEWFNEVCDLLLQILLAHRIEYSMEHREFTRIELPSRKGEGRSDAPRMGQQSHNTSIYKSVILPQNTMGTSLTDTISKCRMVDIGCDEGATIMTLNCRLNRAIWVGRGEKRKLLANWINDNDPLMIESTVSNALWPDAPHHVVDFRLMVHLRNAKCSTLHIALFPVDTSSQHFLPMCYSLFSQKWISDTVKYYTC